MRDYELWHRQYDDPASDLSWRLRTVQGYIHDALDRSPGPIRILSSCSGDGRDVLEALAQPTDSKRVHAVLVQAHPEIADRARRSAAAFGSRVEVRTLDAGVTDAYLGAWHPRPAVKVCDLVGAAGRGDIGVDDDDVGLIGQEQWLDVLVVDRDVDIGIEVPLAVEVAPVPFGSIFVWWSPSPGSASSAGRTWALATSSWLACSLDHPAPVAAGSAGASAATG